MNPGYLSYVWMTCFVILLCSGWRIQLVGDVNRWSVFVFICLWYVLMPFTWHMTPHISLHLSVVLIITLWIIVNRALGYRVQFIVFCLLLVCWHGCMVYIHRWSATSMFHPFLDVAIGEALLTGVYIKKPLHQVTAISWGVMVGLFLEQLSSDPSQIHIGHASMWDQVFIAVLLTRVVSLLAQWSHNKLYSK